MNTRTLILGIGAIIILVAGAYLVLSPSPEARKETQGTQPDTIESTQTNTNAEVDSISETEATIDTVTQETAMPSDPTTPEPTPVVVTPAPVPTPEPTPIVVTPTPIPAPTPNPDPVPTEKSYTLAEVGKHASASSCWSVIDGKVYDLTAFAGKHPGGEKNIMKLCGKDGTQLFQDKHGGESKPETRLSSLYIGDLQ